MKRIIVFLGLLFSLVAVFSQKQNPVQWSYKVYYHNDTIADLELTAVIQDGWHVFSQHQNGIALPLVFSFTPSPNYKPLSSSKYLKEPRYIQTYDAEFNDTSRYFEKKVTFKHPIRILTANDFTITGNLEGQACIDERCIPIAEDFSFKIKGAVLPDNQIIEIQDTVSSDTNIVLTEVVPEEDSDQHSERREESLGWFFILAFLGGLLGILTPCVFPMIPMTVSYFMKNGGRKQALFYGVSIIVIYVIAGIILAAIFGEGFANLISTHWFPNLLFAAIFVLFAFSLFGYFEIALPSRWVNRSAKNEDRAGYVGTFFMATTLVLVSFSCTLPIAGAVALYAAGGSFVKPIIGMLGFSLAFALPFTFFAFFPNMLKNLPKSGGWMNTVKVCLAFVELAFALKFINVPDQAYQWRILDREIYLALWIVLFSMLGLYLLGKIRFPYDDEMPVQKSWFRFTLAIGSFTAVVYMIPGMFGAPLTAISGWLPDGSTQDFDIKRIVYEARYAEDQQELCAQPSFSEKLHTPIGLNGYFDYDEALRCAKAQNKPVFIDFTGHGCVTCRKVERKVFENPRIQKIFNESFIFCVLYVDNKVIKLPKELQIQDKNGNTIDMLGKKNIFLQNTLFNENSQPCYIIVSPEGKVLNGPLFFETNIDVFENFLKQGLSRMMP